MIRLGWLLVAGACWAGFAGPGQAAAGSWATASMVSARLVAAVEGSGDGATVPLGLQLRLEPGWKTYWRSPGDAGLPPALDWRGSSNLDHATLAYPLPMRFSQFGLETVGYETEVVFPVTATPRHRGQPLDLAAGLDLLVCSDICVPQHFDLTLTVPAGPAAPGPEAALVARWAALVPDDGGGHGLDLVSVRAVEAEPVPLLEVVATASTPFAAPDLFVESDPPLAFGAPKLSLSEGGRRATLRLGFDPAAAAAAGTGTALAGRRLTLTLADQGRGLERTVTVAAAGPPAGSAAAVAAGSPPPAAVPSLPGLAAMLGIALLGGLILNLMPCVLPVLSLKLLQVVSHGGAAPGVVRAGFLASAAGIVSSFLALAGVLVALRAGGTVIGWGIQFQQPVFLVLMIVLVTLFACNLWGWFEVILPYQIADRLFGRLETAGGGGHALAGHFVTGALATLLATPCSAPFVGTAVGFALARGPLEIFAIFGALGSGLALPYLAVAALPRLATALPRPGGWMVVLRKLLGGILALTGLWLLWVLASLTAAPAAWAIGALMVALTGLLWARRRLSERTRPAAALAAALLAAVALGVPVLPGTTERAAEATPAVAAEGQRWQRFDPAAIPQLVAAGRTVFVDVTADWCITCQANERLVIRRGEVARRLGDPAGGVVAMRADWTRPDDRIAAYLASFGRYGIPFNVAYGPGAPSGLPLPELLTEGAVIAALDRAGARR